MIFFFQIFHHHRRHTFCIFPRKQISILTSINLYSLVALGLSSSASHFLFFFLIHFTLYSTHKHTIHSIILPPTNIGWCLCNNKNAQSQLSSFIFDQFLHALNTNKEECTIKKYTNNRMFTYERRRGRRTHTFKYYIFCVRNVG